MAIMTFAIISCLRSIINGRFNSLDSLVNDLTKCFLITLFETLSTKLIFFFGLRFSLPFWDALAYCSYKYVGLVYKLSCICFSQCIAWRLFYCFITHKTIFIYIILCTCRNFKSIEHLLK